MNIDEIKELIQLVNESGIAELEVQRGDNRVRIRRSSPLAPQEIVLSPAQPAVLAPTSASSPASAQQSMSVHSGAAVGSTAAPEPDNLTYVKSPIVGTYYDAPSPGAGPFVKVGDRVSVGQTLCIIESMKLMNEIESEVAGLVSRKLVENGHPVEYGESLFAVQPV